MKMIRDIEAALKYAELQLMLSTNDTKTRCFKTIISALRAELSRQENAPLTCEGCANLPTKYGSGVYMNAPCRVCVRGITTRDYYKSEVEPKEEKECKQCL